MMQCMKINTHTHISYTINTHSSDSIDNKMSLEDQVVIHSDLENIADAIRDRKMSSPAVFVIGHVTETRFGAGVGVYSSRFKKKEEMESRDETKMVVVS